MKEEKGCYIGSNSVELKKNNNRMPVLTYSCTINISPFKKLVNGTQFTKEPRDRQYVILYEVLDLLRQAIAGDNPTKQDPSFFTEWGEVRFEETKRKDVHLHTYFKVSKPLTDKTFKWIKDVSSKYGNDQYNKAVDIQYCIDGGISWYKYIHKEFSWGEPVLPQKEEPLLEVIVPDKRVIYHKELVDIEDEPPSPEHVNVFYNYFNKKKRTNKQED